MVNILLEEFNGNYNCYRPHLFIDYLSPMEHYEKCKKIRWVFNGWIEAGHDKKNIDFYQKILYNTFILKK